MKDCQNRSTNCSDVWISVGIHYLLCFAFCWFVFSHENFYKKTHKLWDMGRRWAGQSFQETNTTRIYWLQCSDKFVKNFWEFSGSKLESCVNRNPAYAFKRHSSNPPRNSCPNHPTIIGTNGPASLHFDAHDNLTWRETGCIIASTLTRVRDHGYQHRK